MHRYCDVRLTDRGAFAAAKHLIVSPRVVISPRCGRHTVAHGVSRGSGCLPSPPSPLPPARERGAEGGVRAPYPGLAPWATISRPCRGFGTTARSGMSWPASPACQRGEMMPVPPARAENDALGCSLTGAPSRRVIVLPEIAGTRSPGTMTPTKFSGSAAERVTISGCRGASRCAPASA